MPRYEIKLSQDTIPHGQEVEIPPLGLVKNGTTIVRELDKETAEHLSTAYGVTIKMKRATEGGDKE